MMIFLYHNGNKNIPNRIVGAGCRGFFFFVGLFCEVGGEEGHGAFLCADEG